MAVYKIGDGASYASPTDNVGFSFPKNPRSLIITDDSKVDQVDWELQDFNVVLDKGDTGGSLTAEGDLTASSDMDSLRLACKWKRYLSTNEIDMYYEKKFWHKSDRFRRVKGMKVDTIRTGARTLMYPYRLTMKLVDSFEYNDTEASDSSASAAGTATVTGVDNAGTAYTFPDIEVDRTSGTITKVVVTYNGNTLTWVGSLGASQRLRISQLLQQAIIFATTSTTTPTSYKSYSGIMPIAASVTGASFIFTLTGGEATCRVKVRPRYY